MSSGEQTAERILGLMAKTPYPQTDRELVRRIERSAGGRAGYKQLVRELGLGGGRERRLLLEQLARMTARGELVKIEDEMWALPRATPERTARVPRGVAAEETRGDLKAAGLREARDRLVAGRLDLHRDGYGFVRPNGVANREEDLFVPPTELNGAMQGDEVLVDEAPRDREGRRSGRVVRVLTRRNPTVVGIFHYGAGRRGSRKRESSWVDGALVKGNYVTPLDERIGAAVLIPEGAEVVTEKETSDRVLGEEARAQREQWALGEAGPSTSPLRGSAQDDNSTDLPLRGFGRDDNSVEDSFTPLEGLAVDVEITDFPQPGRPARGRVIEVLGPPDAFGVDVEIVIRKHHLPHVFPTNVLAEAAESAAGTVESAEPEEIGRRRDFRGLPGCQTVTIDGETARDFDDAVLVRELENGNSELQVHIADVSRYVRPGTLSILRRGCAGRRCIFRTARFPCCRRRYRAGCAACGRMRTGLC